MNTLHNQSTLPQFINQKLNHHIDDLIHSNNNSRHLVLGLTPKYGDIVLQSNDYLSLANHEDIIRHHIDSIAKCQNSPLMSGIFLQSEQLKPSIEHQLASFTGFKSCLLSQSGWEANIALLQTICDTGTQVYIDFFAHMSLWEGARIAGCDVHPFMHNNERHLEKLIKRHGAGVVIIDSIYSTIGTIAPIGDIISIAKQHGCAIVVDESHSLGIYGNHGEGLLHQLGVTHLVDFMTASLAKTFAYRAGAIWCNNQANECIPFVAYPAIFSSAMLPYEVERIDMTLKVIKESDDLRARLFAVSQYLKQELTKVNITVRSNSQIISLETGDERNTEKVRDFLEQNGVFGAVFCRPATARNKNLIRFSLNSSVSEQQLDKIIDVCRQAQNRADMYIL
ncbi:quorum-sensing autoinducer CAI-1 synthase [Vibrio brasiliensis]|uniref:alpha-hydroxyketone-type quorum-sensing autoinducer synthase n=1 Tax=Vibrio brasiliensis TaxID=170652 RepID=UPI001EFC6A84|nr:alpha-hydroxyketone-type quorum-sensing autoinducer synthase [Vibrio brasiliensis]MCG9727584.1 quorum-sensing autoinducer CAI-1 synthase [Vibrio brasiliensis]MCG9749425.1 quorum-sensing autoinducer CAI-1 synthase [Vibrio brasiliensis]MCG9782971.1 quorum-sensing autoinducer CAI-1 synthase [Vibrio brasiliensis]